MRVQPLVVEDVDRYLHLLQAVNGESGVDGLGHSHAYSRNDPYDHDAAHDREVTRWSTDIAEPGWRRAWGLFDNDTIVGHIHFVGGGVSTELHRVGMGMGILRSHHRRGGGTQLLTTALDWARAEPGIDWVDLGVFGDNTIAYELYRKHGFEVMGRRPDRFRVDGAVLEDIEMSLWVGQGLAAD